MLDTGTLTFLVVAGLAALGIVLYHWLRGDGEAGGTEGRDDDETRDAPAARHGAEDDESEEDEDPAGEGTERAADEEDDDGETAGWSPNPFLPPLPAPPADFVGRITELVRLREAIEEEGATLCLLRGPAGSGKTALALQLAAELAPRFPDARVFVDLQGQDPAAAGAAGLSALVRALSPEAPIAHQPARMIGQLRTLLAGRQALLIIDAAGPGLELFAPPPGNLLLVTAREAALPRGPEVVAEALEEFPDDEAGALLGRLTRRAGAETAALAKLCDGQPRALRYVAAGLADRAAFPSAEAYAAALAERRQEAEPAAAAAAVLWSTLGEEIRALVAALAVFPRSFDAAAAAAVWRRTPEATTEALTELVRGELLEALGERYRLASPIAELADDGLDDDAFEAAAQRHAEHYTEVLRQMDALRKTPERAKALRLFEEEWEAIRASRRWAAARSSKNATAARLCSEIGETALPWLESFFPEEAIPWTEAALAAARQSGDRAAEARHLLALGQTAFLQHPRQAEEILPTADAALALARELADPEAEMEALLLRGAIEAAAPTTSVESAIATHEQGLALARERGDTHRTGSFLTSLASHWSRLGETQKAIAANEEALPLAQQAEDAAAESLIRWNLALEYEANDETERAVDQLEILAQQARQAGHADEERGYREQIRSLRAGGGEEREP